MAEAFPSKGLEERRQRRLTDRTIRCRGMSRPRREAVEFLLSLPTPTLIAAMEAVKKSTNQP